MLESLCARKKGSRPHPASAPLLLGRLQSEAKAGDLAFLDRGEWLGRYPGLSACRSGLQLRDSAGLAPDFPFLPIRAPWPSCFCFFLNVQKKQAPSIVGRCRCNLTTRL